MSTRDDGLAALTREVESRGGTFVRAESDTRFFDITAPSGGSSRVKVATKATGTWQVTKSDRLLSKNPGVDFWVLVPTKSSIGEAIVVDAAWARELMETKTAAWLAADPTRTLDNDHAAIALSEVAEWSGRWDLLGLGEGAAPVPSSAKAVNETTLGAWVFKCNPDVYDLPAEVADGETFVDNWSVVDNYRSKMIGAGQKAILWMSGGKTGYAPRGIWGTGWTTGASFEVTGLGGGYWVDDQQAASKRWMAPTALAILDEADRLTSDEIAAVPALRDLEVFTAPMGSNPSWVSKDQLVELEKLLPDWPAADDVPETPVTVGPRGAGFGDAETNKKVEMAAMRAVTEYLEKEWDATVSDVSSQNLGWDLTAATPDGEEWHVEVKGVSGSRPVVLLTANEWRIAGDDDSWELAVVTCALSDEPIVTVYEADQMLKCAQPFVMRANMSDVEGWGL